MGWTCKHVRDALTLIDNIENFLSAEETRVMGLPARSRIERCCLQIYSAPIIGNIYDLDGKTCQIAIVIVEPVRRHEQDVASYRTG